MEGVELEFRQDALSAIARKALKRKTGARGLRTIVESVLLDTMYDLPSLENVSKVVVDESVIEHKSDPYLIYQTPPAASQAVAGGASPAHPGGRGERPPRPCPPIAEATGGGEECVEPGRTRR